MLTLNISFSLWPKSSGHATAIGHITKKCVGYSWRSKSCRVCSVAKRRNKQPHHHKCTHNWSGSSKAMEPDMVCEIVKKIENSGVKVANLVGEDTTSMSRLRKEIAHPINKRSDMNHLKKALGNSLYELRKKHKSLSPMVISYFQKLYSYCIRQNQDSAEKLTSGLNNIVSHAFGIHENCDEQWCGYKRNPETFKFSSLPYGKWNEMMVF